MEFHQIKYFLSVAEYLNFTQAAEKCAVSQPALSKAIRKLEENLGKDLLKRNTNKVELTDFGIEMKIHFERIEESKRTAVSAASAAITANTKQINIGIMCTINAHRFLEFINVFHKKNPNVSFKFHDVTPSVIEDKLLHGELDCVFCVRENILDSRFAGLNLFDENMVVAFEKSHRFKDLDEVSILELANERYLDRLYCEFRNCFLQMTKASGTNLNVVFSSEREDWIFELLGKGLGVCIVPESSITAKNISVRKIKEFKNKRRIELVMTEQKAEITPELIIFRHYANNFDWS